MSKSIEISYAETLKELKQRIYESQYNALKAVNKELITLYWGIGETIYQRSEHDGWGNSVVERLAKDLEIEFPNTRGFSKRNLWYMRDFYLAYKDNEILQTLSAQIAWSHNLEILSKCESEQERQYYLTVTDRNGWSVRTLRQKISTGDYQRWLLAQDNFEEKLPPTLARKAEVIERDDYNLDFLLLEDEHKERELEEAIIRNISKFLKEVGEDMFYAGNQRRLEVGEQVYFIDLLFYHRVLRCHIIMELKAGEFKPEYTGKMGMYLVAFEEMNMREDENPPIGIILCKSKDRAVVEYSLKTTNRPVGVATYNAYKNVDDLPPDTVRYLPSPDEIVERLGALIEDDA